MDISRRRRFVRSSIPSTRLTPDSDVPDGIYKENNTQASVLSKPDAACSGKTSIQVTEPSLAALSFTEGADDTPQRGRAGSGSQRRTGKPIPRPKNTQQTQGIGQPKLSNPESQSANKLSMQMSISIEIEAERRAKLRRHRKQGMDASCLELDNNEGASSKGKRLESEKTLPLWLQPSDRGNHRWLLRDFRFWTCADEQMCNVSRVVLHAVITIRNISLNRNSPTLSFTLCYITLRCNTLRYITLHHITSHYITLHYITLRYITLCYVT